ncbi:MAG: hypothetical protein E7394_07620 [Ruminococcaceae bacterium]|nr:hypothetical protein [Oscillospiraceae bacterium]
MWDIYTKDRITGIANKELSVEFALEFARVAGRYISSDEQAFKKVIICRDTRQSGHMLESALCAGLCAEGINVYVVGVVPTSAMHSLVTKYKADMGISITASDLASEYNGFRLFDKTGKAADRDMFSKIYGFSHSPSLTQSMKVGKVRRLHTALRDYVDYVKSYSTLSLSGLKIAIDCANGSAFECAKIIFSERGAYVEVMHNNPDGENINLDCGINNLDPIKNFVTSHKCDMGIALGGDGSNAVLIDEDGNEVSIKDAMDAFSVPPHFEAPQACLIIAGTIADSGKKLSGVKR